MSNLTTALDLGQGVYTKQESDTSSNNLITTLTPVILVDVTLSGSVGGGGTNTIQNYTIPEDGVYMYQMFYTPNGSTNTAAPVIYTAFGTSYGYGGHYNGSSVNGTRLFNAGDSLYTRMYGGNNQSWVLHSGRIIITKIG